MSQVLNKFLAQAPTLTLKGNNTGSTANVTDLTVAQVNAILPVFTSTLNGLVPLSGGGTTNFLRADGTWAAASGGTSNPINLTEIATPSNPASGSNDLYFKTDGNLYTLNSSGVETLVGVSGSTSLNSQFFASSQVTTSSSSINTSTFTTFSNSPAFTFTPVVSGTYKVYSAIPILQTTNGAYGTGRIYNTSSNATLLYESQGISINNGAVNADSVFVQSVYTLIAGNSYQFDIQGQSASAGNISVDGAACPFYMFGELVSSGSAGSKSSIRTVTTSGTLLSTDDFVNVNSTIATTQTLPASVQGQEYNIKNINTGTVTITPTSGTIDGSASITLPVRYTSVDLVFDGTNWWIY